MLPSRPLSAPSRRRALGVIGVAGLVGCADSTSTNARLNAAADRSTVAALIESAPALFRDSGGPVYVRSDFIDAVPLTFTLTLANVNDDCRPVVGALVQAWQCNRSFSPENADVLTGGLLTTDCNGQIRFGTTCPGSGSRIHLRAYLRGVLDSPPETVPLPRDLTTAIYDTSIYVIRDRNIGLNLDEALSPNVSHQLCSMAASDSGECNVSLRVGLAL